MFELSQNDRDNFEKLKSSFNSLCCLVSTNDILKDSIDLIHQKITELSGIEILTSVVLVDAYLIVHELSNIEEDISSTDIVEQRKKLEKYNDLLRESMKAYENEQIELTEGDNLFASQICQNIKDTELKQVTQNLLKNNSRTSVSNELAEKLITAWNEALSKIFDTINTQEQLPIFVGAHKELENLYTKLTDSLA
ncbi:hypothetical protein [Gloeocapsa sp. PCC 73106]|uniref:hypothetical protein n=1 Tax=Gloeocapsa sp. PCC 73106 TaxID=102232 RepID=UPI0002AC4B1D|nr:hypothetical protein [Gloeocapsa sp. PCC 73106]ELR99925.1 hypothetical protein GLO73106DRAFT_00037780 [Gloeocapsa sp. PCC 73106]